MPRKICELCGKKELTKKKGSSPYCIDCQKSIFNKKLMERVKAQHKCIHCRAPTSKYKDDEKWYTNCDKCREKANAYQKKRSSRSINKPSLEVDK